MNESGQVAGVGNTGNGEWHAFFWSATSGMLDLGTLGGNESVAFGMNSSGHVVGASLTANGEMHSFIWTLAEGMIDINPEGPFTYAVAVNDSDEVAGIFSMGAPDWLVHPFLWTAAGGMIDLGTLGAVADYALADHISNSGHVVGRSWTTAGEEHLFVWTAAGGMVDLGIRGSPMAVNDDGQVVGEWSSDDGGHAFSWTAAGGMVDLGTLGGGYSEAVALGDRQVVGLSTLRGDGVEHAFSWIAPSRRVVDLGTLGGGSFARAVSQNGQVVGGSEPSRDSLSVHAALWQTVDTILAIDSLSDCVNSYGFKRSLASALDSKLKDAISSWLKGHSDDTLSDLAAFINQVNAQRGKAMTAQQADALIAMAQAIINAINNGTAV